MQLQFSDDQRAAMTALESGKNVFLTGKAGTGKTCVLNEFIRWALDNKKNLIVCASTGAAAQRIEPIKATTIHRAFGLNKEPIVMPPKRYKKEIAAADIIIIDEISMCRIDLFEHVAEAIRMANKRNGDYERKLARKEGRPENYVQPIQLVVTGDFSQLEPVLTSADRSAFRSRYKNKLFAFESPYWKAMNFVNAELTTVHRQIDDSEYTEALNEARDGSDPFCVDWFNFNTAKDRFTGEDSIILCGKNATASEKNLERLDEIKGEEFYSKAEITGDADMASTNAEYELRFKVGAKVMMLVNGPGYFNGSFGTIKAYYPNDDGDWGDEPRVKIHLDETDEDVYVEKYKWDIVAPEVVKETKEEKDPITGEIKTVEVETIQQKSVGCVSQFPFKLAWAITIHKSQGMTLKCGVNLYPEFFANGQLYVALSRVDRRENIYIEGLLDYQDLRASAKVRKFYGTQ